MNAYIDLGAYDGDTAREFLCKYTRTDPRAFTFFLFECHPNTVVDLPVGVESYVLRKVAWIEDGTVPFYLGTPLGSSVIRTKTTGGLKRRQPVHIPTIDFSNWLERFSEDDYVVVKMNIEGAEYPVIDKLCEDGTIYKINELYLSLHTEKVQKNSADDQRLIDRLVAAEFSISEAAGGLFPHFQLFTR